MHISQNKPFLTKCGWNSEKGEGTVGQSHHLDRSRTPRGCKSNDRGFSWVLSEVQFICLTELQSLQHLLSEKSPVAGRELMPVYFISQNLIRLPCAMPSSNHFTNINSFSLHNNAMEQIQLLSPFYRQKTGAQAGQITRPRSVSREAEPGLKPGQSGPAFFSAFNY